jgi:hypothetical protein
MTLDIQEKERHGIPIKHMAKASKKLVTSGYHFKEQEGKVIKYMRAADDVIKTSSNKSTEWNEMKDIIK